jgi:hypothetical protein
LWELCINFFILLAWQADEKHGNGISEHEIHGELCMQTAEGGTAAIAQKEHAVTNFF